MHANITRVANVCTPTIEFLAAILPKDCTYFLVLHHVAKGFTHKPYRSIPDMAAAAMRYDALPDFTVYHACAGYSADHVMVAGMKKFRIPQNLKSIQALWVDLDCGEEKARVGQGYATKKGAAASLWAFCEGTGFPAPMLVDSGRGLHAYWPLTEAIAPDVWQKTATRFKAALARHGVLADPSRTADGASILRPPETRNKKDPEHPKIVRVVNPATASSIAEINAILDKLLGAEIVLTDTLAVRPAYLNTVASNDLNADLTAHAYPEVPADAELMATKCKQARLFKESGCVDEPTWKAMIGVVRLCVDGDAVAHSWSSQSAQYSQAETQRKIDACIDKPATCAHIESCNPAGCTNCPVKGTVSTPLQLGRVPHAGVALAAQTAETPDAVSELNQRYTVIADTLGIYDRLARKYVQRAQLSVYYANNLVNVGTAKKPHMTTADVAWCRSPYRSQHTQLDLDPNQGETMRNGALNTFEGFTVAAAPGDIAPFLALFDWLIPETERAYVLAWMACAMQRLGERFHVALVIWSRLQGTGKNLIFETFGTLINPAHFVVVGQDVFTSQFNAWQRGNLITIFDEVSAAKSRSVGDQIKVLLTATVRHVNGKYEPSFTEPNRLKGIFLSNHPDAVALDDTDRRFYVVEANSTLPPQAMIDQFLAWKNAGGQAALLHFLQKYDTGTFNPKAPAPATRAKREMIEDNLSDLERWLQGITSAHDLVKLLGRDLCTADELAQRYTQTTGNKASTKAITNVLRKVGVPRMEKQARKSDGSKSRCYALRNASQYAAMTDGQLGELLDVAFKIG